MLHFTCKCIVLAIPWYSFPGDTYRLAAFLHLCVEDMKALQVCGGNADLCQYKSW